MKKLIAVLVISLLAVTAVFAQQSDPAEPNAGRAVDVSSTSGGESSSSSSSSNFIFGFKAGIGMSKFRAVDTTGYYEDQYSDPLIGWQIGARMGYFFSGMFGIMIDVEYIRKGYTTSSYYTDEKLTIDYVDVNVMFAIKAGGFYAGLGLYAGFKINSHYSINDVDYGSPTNLKDTDFGVALTLGYMFGGPMKIFVGIDIKFGITNLLKNTYYSHEIEYKNVGIFLNFGLLFSM